MMFDDDPYREIEALEVKIGDLRASADERIADLRAQLERVTAERDALKRERDQARKEVAAMEAAAREVLDGPLPGAPGADFAKQLARRHTALRILDALKKARGDGAV